MGSYIYFALAFLKKGSSKSQTNGFYGKTHCQTIIIIISRQQKKGEIDREGHGHTPGIFNRWALNMNFTDKGPTERGSWILIKPKLLQRAIV